MLKNKYQEKKKLILFLSVLILFSSILTGCNWFSNGIINIFDPQAQIRLISMNYSDEEQTMINIEVATINEVEFIGSGFKFEYYIGSNHIESLDRTTGANFYINPTDTPGEPGESTSVEDILLYSGDVMSYAKSNSAFGSLSCDIYLLGEGSGYSQSIKVVTGIAAMGTDNELPEAKIETFPSPATGPPPLTISFDASGSTDNRGISDYSWNYGDGSSGTGPIVSHTYSAIGNYAVQLTVTDYFGNEAYASTTVEVTSGEGPEVDIIVTPDTTGQKPFTVYFTADVDFGGCGCNGEDATYSWDFGDGDSDTGSSTSHTYVDNGTFIVVLTVTDSNGNVGYDSEIITVGVSGDVTAVIETTPGGEQPTGTTPFTVGFNAAESTTSASGETIISYTWDFDGTVIIHNEDPPIPVENHTFEGEGTYLVQLTVEDSAGNIGYAFVSIKVNPSD